MKINIHIDKEIFNPCYYPYLCDFEHATQIFYGGSSSGKSFFLATRCVLDMVKGGHNYLIARQVAKTIRKSVWNEILKAISRMKLTKYFKINSSELVITAPDGGQILFVGLDDVEKVKSISPAKGVIDTTWIEEATEIKKESMLQLKKRMRGKTKYKKRMVLSFNPIWKQSWLYMEFFAGHWDDASKEYHDDNLSILKTTYKDNRFLTEDDVYSLEHETDRYFYEVYTLGNFGVLGHVIFTNWHTEDLSARKDDFDHIHNGCDFGFANDPTALVRVAYQHNSNTLYILDAKYLHGYTNDLVAAEISNMIQPNEVIVCDCAEPKSIQELKQLGINAIPCTKGKDSINYGIRWLQSLNIVIDKSLTEVINEFTIYRYQEDKEGNVLPKPVDRDNHCIDAIRYALFREMEWNGARQNYSDIKWPTMGSM